MREYRFADLQNGHTESFTRTVTKEMEEAFRMISGDENLLHRNDEFARDVSAGKFTKHVVFGMLTASFYSTLAGMYLPGKYSLIHSLENLSFQQPVFVGDTLKITGKIVDKDENLHLLRIKATIKNQNQQTVSKTIIKVMVMK